MFKTTLQNNVNRSMPNLSNNSKKQIQRIFLLCRTSHKTKTFHNKFHKPRSKHKNTQSPNLSYNSKTSATQVCCFRKNTQHPRFQWHALRDVFFWQPKKKVRASPKILKQAQHMFAVFSSKRPHATKQVNSKLNKNC